MKRIKMPSNAPSSRLIKWVTISLAGIAIILFAGSVILSRYATKKVEEQLKSTGGTFESLTVNLFLQRITIAGFKLTAPGDTSNTSPYKASIKNIVFKDVSLYQFLKNKTIHIGEILIADGDIQLNRRAKKQSAATGKKREQA